MFTINALLSQDEKISLTIHKKQIPIKLFKWSPVHDHYGYIIFESVGSQRPTTIYSESCYNNRDRITRVIYPLATMFNKRSVISRQHKPTANIHLFYHMIPNHKDPEEEGS